LEYTPGWTIGGFFIPFYCFVRPYRVMSEIWQASDPNSDGEQSWKWKNSPPILRWWWGFFLVTNILSNIASRMTPQENAKNLISQLSDQSYVLLLADFVDIFAAIVAVLAIRSVDARQTAGLERLMIPPPVPPAATAEIL